MTDSNKRLVLTKEWNELMEWERVMNVIRIRNCQHDVRRG